MEFGELRERSSARAGLHRVERLLIEDASSGQQLISDAAARRREGVVLSDRLQAGGSKEVPVPRAGEPDEARRSGAA